MSHQFTKLTPNLIVSDVARTVAFVVDIHGVHESLKDRVTVVMPLEHKWYGVTEFAMTDPAGYVVTFAERDR